LVAQKREQIDIKTFNKKNLINGYKTIFSY